jgi:hypothetical protein
VVQSQYEYTKLLDGVTTPTANSTISGRFMAQAMASFGAPASGASAAPALETGGASSPLIATSGGPVAHRSAYA